MGASVVAYWPGITETQLEEQPGFFNDCKAWGDWMAEREQHPDILAKICELGVGDLLTFTTDGVADSEVDWVSPHGLASAARKLRSLVVKKDPSIERVVETYGKSANKVDSMHEEFAQDLEDIAKIAEYAAQQKIMRMTLEVNW